MPTFHAISFLFFFFFVCITITSKVTGSKICEQTKDQYVQWTQRAQSALYALNHPLDCSRANILVCSTRVKKFQGSGSRLFYLGRCLAEGLNSDRTVVVNNDLQSTLHILAPFEPWSNCSMSDVKTNKKKGRLRFYSPMESRSLLKNGEMPAVGALYPKSFMTRGYWWWKAQEITYALRPSVTTTQMLKERVKNSWKNAVKSAVIQVRRTDKTEGCSKFYGEWHYRISILWFIFDLSFTLHFCDLIQQ